MFIRQNLRFAACYQDILLCSLSWTKRISLFHAEFVSSVFFSWLFDFNHQKYLFLSQDNVQLSILLKVIRLLMNIQIAWMFCCNNILKHLIIISQHVPNAKLQCNFEAEGLIIVPFTWNCSISNWMTHEWVLTFNIFESIFVQNPNCRIWTKKKMQAYWTKVKTTKKLKKRKFGSIYSSKNQKVRKKSPTQGKCWH